MSDKLEHVDRVFEITKTTPYAESEILNFMCLTGLNIEDTEIIMAKFCKYGISNLTDVNTLVKMGYFKSYRCENLKSKQHG